MLGDAAHPMLHTWPKAPQSRLLEDVAESTNMPHRCGKDLRRRLSNIKKKEFRVNQQPFKLTPATGEISPCHGPDYNHAAQRHICEEYVPNMMLPMWDLAVFQAVMKNRSGKVQLLLLCRENGRNRTGFFAVIQQKIAHADNKTKKRYRQVCFSNKIYLKSYLKR